MGEASPKARAIVASEPLAERPGPNWSLEDVTVQPIRDNQALVEIVAVGICHTDIVMTSIPEGFAGVHYPRVAGHEGAGYVRAVGKDVSSVEVGDPVLLSFDHCKACTQCKTTHPAFCQNFVPLNVGGEPESFKVSSSSKSASGSFFGQSSFASLTAVKEASIVNVKGLIRNDEEMKLFAPLGCGLQTGSASLIKLGGADESSQVVVMGLGGVGLAAVMAAKIQGCRTIIGVDRVRSRLELAKSLGASHVLDTSPDGFDLVKEVMEITEEGASIAVDASGVPELVKAAMSFIGNMGRLILVGILPRDFNLEIPGPQWMASGKQLIGSVEGDAVPTDWVPKMIQWYREGRFPIEKLIKYFPADQFAQALQEMHAGTTIKAVMVF